jgi:hypothetical protein
MTVTAGIVGNLLVPTPVAFLLVAAERRGAAGCEVPEDPLLVCGG